ncbi:MAG TPA: homocysteine S-methyltransferase family protein [Bacteroidota bacterium]|nr:homocysteine S-methyltransferase family protein [Bacteroidota bacterium]
MTHPLFSSLLARGPVITDGAWGTELQKLGLAPGEHPDLWNLSHPDLVEQVASRYVRSGSAVILTNTFRSNRIALGAGTDAAALNAAGVRISRKAAAGRARVFASVGPSGKMLMSEEVTAEELSEAFAEQCHAIAAAGADAILIETMTDLEEARIAVRAARTTGLPVIASMVFDSGKEKDRTMMGATPEQVAAALEAAGVDAIGANCGLGIEGYIPVCSRLRKATSLPLWIKPNAGMPEMTEGRITYRTTPEQFGARALDLRRAGADFIGGCCGTTPEFIRAVVATLIPSP